MTLSLLFMLISGIAVVYVNCRNTTSDDVISAAGLTLMSDGSVDIELAGKHIIIQENAACLKDDMEKYLYALCPESFKSAAELTEAVFGKLDFWNKNNG